MKHIFFDLDGTLFSAHGELIPDSALLALKKLKANKHKVYIATGRPYHQIQDLLKRQIIDWDGYICGAGTYVEFNGEVILNEQIDMALVDEVITHTDKLNIGIEIDGEKGGYFSKKGLADMYHNIKEAQPEYTDKDIQDRLDNIFNSKEFSGYKNDKICKFMISGFTQETLKQLEDLIGDRFQFVTGEKRSEILLKKYNKATGISFLAQHSNVSINDCIGIGDSLNDYEMIRDCGIGVAMGNAHPLVKEVADYISADASADGIYQAIKALDLI
ncbi:MAG: HAD family hydrolase [Erysipelotrichaceae bacterium]